MLVKLMMCLICGDPQVRDKMNLKVNSICAPEESCSKRPPSRNIESLRWEKINLVQFFKNQYSIVIFVVVVVLFYPDVSVHLLHLFTSSYWLSGVLGSSPTSERCLTPPMRSWVTSVTSTGCMTCQWAMSEPNPWLKRYAWLKKKKLLNVN